MTSTREPTIATLEKAADPHREKENPSVLGYRYRISTNDKKFTTYQRDQESGLDYAVNRFFQYREARFVSVDKGAAVRFVPQTLNRYTYTVNDPRNYTDPSGDVFQCSQYWDGETWRRGPCFDVPPRPNGSDPINDWLLEWQRQEDMAFEESNAREFAKIVEPARREARNKLQNAQEDCEALFVAIGFTSTKVEAKLANMFFKDGTMSGDLIENIANPAYARVTGTVGWTVATLFNHGFPPLPVQPANQRVVPAGRRSLPPTLSYQLRSLDPHETLHQLADSNGQLQDPDIMKKWGLDTRSPSSQIANTIREKCD